MHRIERLANTLCPQYLRYMSDTDYQQLDPRSQRRQWKRIIFIINMREHLAALDEIRAINDDLHRIARTSRQGSTFAPPAQTNTPSRDTSSPPPSIDPTDSAPIQPCEVPSPTRSPIVGPCTGGQEPPHGGEPSSTSLHDSLAGISLAAEHDDSNVAIPHDTQESARSYSSGSEISSFYSVAQAQRRPLRLLSLGNSHQSCCVTAAYFQQTVVEYEEYHRW